MLTFVWSLYIVTVFSLSVLIFLQKGEDTVSTSQSTFMTPRSMSTFFTKATYFLYFLFIALSITIGILIKNQKIALDKEFSQAEQTTISEKSEEEMLVKSKDQNSENQNEKESSEDNSGEISDQNKLDSKNNN